MENTEIKDCKLNVEGFCECYLKKCTVIKDCSLKILIKKGLL